MTDGQECGALLDSVSATGVAGPPRWRSAPAWPRRLFRFSVRRLLVLILVIGCGMGWMARVVRSGQAQRRAVAAVGQAGGWVVYDTQWDDGQQVSRWRPRWPRWLVDCAGVDFLGNVVFINLHDRGNDALLAHVGRFRHLKQLHRPGFAVTDAGLAHLGQLDSLQLLSLDGTQVTDAGLIHLKRLTSLRWLKIARTKISVDSIRELQKSLPHLQAIR